MATLIREISVHALANWFIECHECASSRGINIVDIGPGSGRLLSEFVIELRRRGVVASISLHLIDISPIHLREARSLLSETLVPPATIHSHCIDIGKFTGETLETLVKGPISCIVASASLHHLPAKIKVLTLKKFAQFRCPLFLLELEADHDDHPSRHGVLISSAISFYSALIADVMTSHMPPHNKLKCIDEFLIPEVLGILFGSRSDRGNFHTTRDGWRRCATAAGWIVQRNVRRRPLRRVPPLLGFQLQPKLSDREPV